MEAMFMIPGLAGPVTGSMSYNHPTPSIAKKNVKQDTHDTCSCGSDNNNNNNASKQPLQASVSNSDSPSSSHLRTLTTAVLLNEQKPAFGTMDADLADELVEKTEQRVEHALLKASAMFQSRLSVDMVPKLTMDEELTRQDLLGSGGFASVYSVQIKDPSQLRFHKEGQDYVVKHLSPKLLANGPGNRRKLHAGAKDIILESHILSALHHRNIVTVHGLSPGGVHSFGSTQRTDAYFMVLPRLQCTLADKISAWKREKLQDAVVDTSRITAASKGPWWRRTKTSPSDKQSQQAQQLEFLCERLEIMVELCQALEYLHSKRIMHRDVKPPNIGFDHEGCLKLFDFGLAKELPPDSAAYSSQDGSSATMTATSKSNKTFQHLGNTGTTRYMAPEVIRREAYNCKVDVFATSIVTWELMTLKKPYGVDVSGQFVKECVAIYDDRPSIPNVSKRGNYQKHQTRWPKALKRLVQQGWTKDIGARLTAAQMKVGLQEILTKKQQQYLQSKVLLGESPVDNSKKKSVHNNLSLTLSATMSC